MKVSRKAVSGLAFGIAGLACVLFVLVCWESVLLVLTLYQEHGLQSELILPF